MSHKARTRSFHWLLLLPLLLLCTIPFFWHTPDPAPTPQKLPTPPPELAALGLLPDWQQLEKFQDTISKDTFLDRLERIYTKGPAWQKWINVSETHATIQTHDQSFTLRFSSTDKSAPGAIWNWQKSTQLRDLHIAIDPGHIGGDFAEIEERNLEYPGVPPIREGTMTLLTAQHLKPLLEEQGAKVTLVRTKNEPVTQKRAANFPNPKLFYRTAEIRARADLINNHIKPDLVICLHFNASSSAVPIPGQHFHIILPGTFHEGELAHEDERFEMLSRLLSGTIETEIPLASSIAEAFVSETRLPPYQYKPDHAFSNKVDNNPYLWARNLLANRLYQCPVVFLEPYVMNSTDFIARINAGDYPGWKMVDGKLRRSVYREYAHAVAEGLSAYENHTAD